MRGEFPGARQTKDDGAYDHLRAGVTVPPVTLSSTVGGRQDVLTSARWTVLFLFPATGMPGEPDPVGWLDTPGAYGCTEESCGFRDIIDQFRMIGAEVRGVSNQTMREQETLANRLGLPYPLMSDEDHQLIEALQLPTFSVGDSPPRIRRATLVVTPDRRIERVFYPIPTPATHANEVLEALRSAHAA